MSPGKLLRDMVTARLTAAAEEIFELFDKTIAAYMEELGRSKEENQRKQRLLDSLLNPRIELVRVSAHIPSTCPSAPNLTQKTTQTPQINDEPEEQSTRQEEQLLLNESTEREESPPPHQRQAEHREETQKEDTGSECEIQTENSSDMDGDANWVRPLSSAECSEAEADGDPSKQVQIRRNESASEMSAVENNGVMQGADGGAERKKHQLPVRKKRCKRDLRVHSSVRTGGRPFSCSVCVKTFDQRSHLLIHQRIHSKEKPYTCSICKKTFSQQGNLDLHQSVHTKEKPYRCSVCTKRFSQKGNRDPHKRTHTGEKPFSCRVCNKTFRQQGHLDLHQRVHTKEKPYSCTLCKTTFSQRSQLNQHLKRTHKAETPFSCRVCNKTFSQRGLLKSHQSEHAGTKSYSLRRRLVKEVP